MKEFRFIGSHADELDDGRPLEPGMYTGPIDERAAKNDQLIESGVLIPVPKGTADKAEKANAAATSTHDDEKDS